MKRNLLFLAVMVVAALLFTTNSWAAQDPNDLGMPDSLMVKTVGCDHTYEQNAQGYDEVRVTVYVSHDSNTFWWPAGNKWVQDSIAAFVVPFTFWHQPEGCADSVILPNWLVPDQPPEPGDITYNNTSLDPEYLPYSVFRNIVCPPADTIKHRMKTLNWDTRVLDIESHSCDHDSGHAWFSLIAGQTKKKWYQGSNVPLATLTFLVYMNPACDTTEIGIDSISAPPQWSLGFVRYDAEWYVPTVNLPVKDTIYIIPCLPPNITCPGDEERSANGTYTTTTQWSADDGNPGDPTVTIPVGGITVVGALPPGISAASVTVTGPALPAKSTFGTVTYTVNDHCAGGGIITLQVINTCPAPLTDTCSFNVTLTNEWTILVYMNGDNNQESAAIDDINEMEMVGSSDYVNIIVQVDRIPGDTTDTTNGDWTDTRRYYIVKDTVPNVINSIRLDTLPPLGELNMGDPQTLVNFVNWGIYNYPADYYAVVVWDHGDGWYKKPFGKDFYPDDILLRGMSFDYTDTSNIGVSDGEWESAISEIEDSLGRNVDLVGFDARLMQMWEVMDITDDYADYMVGSEEFENWNGWYYTQFLDSLTNNPAMSPEQLGREIVDAAVDGDSQSTQSCVDLARVSALSTAVDNFARELIRYCADCASDTIVRGIRSQLNTFDTLPHIDLYDFADSVYRDNRLPASLTSAANDVMNAVSTAVTWYNFQPAYNWVRGIAIYYPEDTSFYDSRYSNLPVAPTTLWDNFIGVPLDVDLALQMWGAPRPRPGFSKTYWVRYFNLSQIKCAENVVLRVTLPPEVRYSASYPPGDTNGQNISWNLGTVRGGYVSDWVTVAFYIDSLESLGTVLSGEAEITTTSTDGDSSNNKVKESERVVGSSDPNEKLVTPEDGILRTDTLRYQLNFQNVGTDTAFNIVVRDTLDSNLDITTTESVASSHPSVFTIAGRELSWTFANINLPDSTTSEPKSHGFVSFRVRPRSDVAYGTDIQNRAGIYFDFNPPVITNTVLNWIFLPYNVTIANISDVGNDQGKQVRIKWTSFPGDDPSVTDFTIFRRIDTLLSAPLKDAQHAFPIMDYPPGEWDIVGTYQAFGETLYSAVVPTLKDSTIAQGMYWSAFFIRAGTNNPIVYFDSPVDSGYSLDNLSPSPPTGLFASHAPASTKLIWHTTPITDFDYHTVYRDTIPGFPPSLSNRVGFTIDTTFTDSTAQLGRTYYYLVTATDFSDNESDPSNEAIGVRYITGDVNGDGLINAADVVYLINYLYIHGPEPIPLEAGDVDCDGVINAADVVYLINYLYIGGPPPCVP